MLCARIARRTRGLVSSVFAPVPQANSHGLCNYSDERNPLKLGDILEALIKGSSPGHEDRTKRLRVIHELQQSLGRAHFGPTIDLRILPFGSFVNSLYEPSSDLDLAIVGEIVATDDLSPDDKRHPFVELQLVKLPREHVSDILRRAVSQFVADGLADERSLVPVLHARVPIVKLVHPGTGVHVDVCVGAEGDAFKTWSLAQLMALNPAAERLCRLVKIWARAHGINDARSSTFNSWCLTLLVVFFLQRHAEPVLLPPLKELMSDHVGPAGALVRPMHGGRQPSSKRVMSLMATITRNGATVRPTYGQRPPKPLEQLFLDFLESTGRMLQAAIEQRKPLTKGTAVSVFHGDYHSDRFFRRSGAPLFVEDPLDGLDNAARTLRVPAASKGQPIEFMRGTFEQSAARLRAHLEALLEAGGPAEAAAAAAGPEGGAQQQPQLLSPTLPEAAAAGEAAGEAARAAAGEAAGAAGPSSLELVLPGGGGGGRHGDGDGVVGPQPAAAPHPPPSCHSPPPPPGPTVDDARQDAQPSRFFRTFFGPGAVSAAAVTAAVTAAGRAACTAPASSELSSLSSEASLSSFPSSSSSCPPLSPSPSGSLASACVFLFGTELLTRLPQLSERLLGPGLVGWARGALAEGRPAGEVHRELLVRLGVEQGFEPFVAFRKRCGLRVLDMEATWTAEGLEALFQQQKPRRLGREVEAGPRRRALEVRRKLTQQHRNAGSLKMRAEQGLQGQERGAQQQGQGTKRARVEAKEDAGRQGAGSQPASRGPTVAGVKAAAAAAAAAAAGQPRRGGSRRPAAPRRAREGAAAAAAAERPAAAPPPRCS